MAYEQPWIKSVFADEDGVLLVKVGDVEELSHKVERLVKDTKLRRKPRANLL